MTPRVLIDGRPAQGRPRGMGVYVLRLLPELAAQADGLALSVALDRRAGEDPWPGDLPVERVWGDGGNPLRWEQRALPALVQAAHANLLHTTANTSPWHCPVPLVATVHDAIGARPLTALAMGRSPRLILAQAYYRFATAPGARRAVRVITDSDYSRGELIRKLRLDPGRLRVIPLGVPHATAPLPRGDVDARLEALALSPPYVLGLGALDARKNTENLVRAFARLPRAAAATLVLAGFEKAGRSQVPGLLRLLGITDRVRILGYVDETQLTALFQGAAVFAYPSREEGFGLPILQAFTLGVPVITCRTGSIPEVAQDAVRYVDPDRPHALTRALLTVLTDSGEAHRLALAGHLQAKRFSWSATAARTLAVYREVLAPAATP